MNAREALDAWPALADVFRFALRRHDGSYDEYDMANLIFRGQWQLWVWPHREAVESICATEVVQYPQLRKLHVRCIAGTWPAFVDNLAKMESYARQQGCHIIEAAMRQGLTRRLPPDWRAHNVNMVKRLD